MLLKEDVCREWVQSMDTTEFDELRESIAYDRVTTVDSDDVPTCPEGLLSEPTIASRGIFDSRVDLF